MAMHFSVKTRMEDRILCRVRCKDVCSWRFHWFLQTTTKMDTVNFSKHNWSDSWLEKFNKKQWKYINVIHHLSSFSSHIYLDNTRNNIHAHSRRYYCWIWRNPSLASTGFEYSSCWHFSTYVPVHFRRKTSKIFFIRLNISKRGNVE